MAPARFLQRFCATAVDACLGFGLGLGLVAALTVARHFNPRTFGPRDDWLIGPGHAALDVALLAAWLYYAGCESSPLAGDARQAPARPRRHRPERRATVVPAHER